MKKAWETEKSPNQRAGVAKHGVPPAMRSVPEKTGRRCRVFSFSMDKNV
jgi:hypothetical protein